MLWATLGALIVLCLLGFTLRDAGLTVHLLMVALGLVLLYNLVADSRRALLRSLAQSNGPDDDRRFREASRENALDETASSSIDGA